MGALNSSAIRESMSSWLNSYSWDLFITYTFEEHFSFDSAKRALDRHYSRMKAKFNREYPFFYVVEPHSNYALSGTHAHGLVGGVADIRLSGKRMQVDWCSHQGHGVFEFDKYMEDKGAGYYLTKYLVKSEYDQSFWDVYNLPSNI